jgi:hypothetical protein
MAVISRKGSDLVKEVRTKKEAGKSRSRFWELAGEQRGEEGLVGGGLRGWMVSEREGREEGVRANDVFPSLAPSLQAPRLRTSPA